MYALSDDNRQQLMRLSVMIVCGGTAILPFTVSPTSSAAQAQAMSRTAPISVPDVPGKLEFPVISVERDPFLGDAGVLPIDIHPTTSGITDTIGIVLPPNDGAQGSVPATDSGSALPVVRGIVLGDTPQALVDAGGGVKVVSVGDMIGNETIRAISANGVTLSSGLRLRMAGVPQ